MGLSLPYVCQQANRNSKSTSVPIPRWNFLQNIRIWSQYAPDSLGKFNGSWLHSTATSDRVMFLGYFNNGTFLSNQMAIAYIPMKPFPCMVVVNVVLCKLVPVSSENFN